MNNNSLSKPSQVNINNNDAFSPYILLLSLPREEKIRKELDAMATTDTLWSVDEQSYLPVSIRLKQATP